MPGRKRILVLLVILATVAAIVTIGWRSIPNVSAGADRYEKLRLFTEVLSVVERSYVEKTDTKDLIYSAIKGMMRSLDPHSAFLTPNDYKEMQVDTKGEFGGLGIQISIRDNVLTIISPIEDTPAWRAGIKAGDKIIKIDDESTKDMTLHDAVSRMRGAKGTKVTISIMREGVKGLTDYPIVRDIIKIKSVKSKVLQDDIGYVKIVQFQERTARDLSKALKQLSSKDIIALVLDLRNNPGGLLNSAVAVSSRFLPRGTLVVYIKARDGEKTEYKTSGSHPQFALPIVVLVNQGSASASEIVAGALKDWKRAVILGVKTFGKGSVQSVVPLSDGAGLRLTTARYYTPNGITIQSTGITPDITVKLAPGNGQKEHPVLREKDLKGHLKNEQNGEAETKPSPKKKPEKAVLAPVSDEEDAQLQRAIDLLKTWTIFKEITAAEPTEAAPQGVLSNP